MTRRPPAWRCSEETPSGGGAKYVAPIYLMKTAADRQLAGTPRCVDLLLNFNLRRYLPLGSTTVPTVSKTRILAKATVPLVANEQPEETINFRKSTVHAKI